MKLRLLFIALPVFITALLAVRLTDRNQTAQQITDLNKYKQENSIRCTPDWDVLKEALDEVDIPPIPGAGSYKWKITTTSDSAQFYFNQ